MASGIVNIYKEKGYTSFDVVAKLRGIYHMKKIGHTGTLDPDAEGVLPVCLGKATRVVDLLTDRSKEYQAVLLLGMDTDTQDTSGQILAQAEVEVTEDQVREAILSFQGDSLQIPPMYSALKVNGKKLYELAREGKTIERKARPIHLSDIQILSMDLPEVTFQVTCSKGTYIRTLCHDIGEKLGCHGCMKHLLRTRVGQFDLEHAYRIEEIQDHPEDFLQPVDLVFSDLPACKAKPEADKFIKNGNKLAFDLLEEEPSAPSYRLYDARDCFVGVFTTEEGEEISFAKPLKIFYEEL